MNDTSRKTLEQVVDECGRYPLDAFEFVRHGLNHAVERIHGNRDNLTDTQCHVTGQQLSLGLRDYAVLKYGTMAEAVLNHWRIHRTGDFGRIVFAMVESRLMQKTDEDDLRDFEDVYDFRTAFGVPPRPSLAHPPVFQL